MEFSHRPVMAREVVESLNCRPGGVYLDGTVGGGGHAAGILDASAPDGRLIGLDRDPAALKAAGERLQKYGSRAALVKANFRDIKKVLEGLGISLVDGIVLDLGVSSYQLETPERGFSFRFEARLDMRMDATQGATARDLVNELPADELARIFTDYGEERHARRIARLIEKAREARPIETTGDLVRIIIDATPARFRAGAIHPATRAFQALRIAVNDELGSLERGLPECVDSLAAGARMSVISFHSLEDRIVKNFFRERAAPCVCPPRAPFCVCGKKPSVRLVSRKALTPSQDEVAENPRARSAKMRVVEKI